MSTNKTIQKLQKELAVISEISKEIPLPYKTIIDAKIIGFKAYLKKIEPDLGENNNLDLDQKTK